jgi:hypothetical protein
MKIRTNHQPRPILHPWDLSLGELGEFDYHLEGKPPTEENWTDSGAQFFRYRGQLYDLGEFVRIVPQGGHGGGFAHHDHSGSLAGWDGIATDSYFSATLIKIGEDCETVTVGYATW